METLKLAVSGETVYAGKRDGHLFRSLDGGNTWKDLTANFTASFQADQRNNLRKFNGVRCDGRGSLGISRR